MRTRIAGLATALTLLVVTASAAGAQEPAAGSPRGTISGVVTDSLSGLPVLDAAVSLEAGRAVLTDAQGHFALNDVPREGQVSVAVDQLGYHPSFLMVDAGVSSLAIKLAPDSAAIRGLKRIARDLQQQTGLMGNVRYYTRRDLLKDNARDLPDFLRRHGAYAPVRAPYPRGPDNLLGLGQAGVQVNPNLYIDGSAILGGFAGLPAYQLRELYGVVLANGGANIVVWSNAYVERLARGIGKY